MQARGAIGLSRALAAVSGHDSQWAV